MKQTVCMLAALLLLTFGGCALQTGPEQQEAVMRETAAVAVPATDAEPAVSVTQMEYAPGSIFYENVWMAEDIVGTPMVQYAIRNQTDKAIVSYHKGMLAFDADGMPLELYWNGLDTENGPAWHFLCNWLEDPVPAGGRYEMQDGGWVFFSRLDSARESYDRIAYVLYNLKQVTFEDGSVWENPTMKAGGAPGRESPPIRRRWRPTILPQ